MAISYTTSGRGLVADLIDNTVLSATFYGAWGTGGSGTGSTATSSDTALQAEATEVRGTIVTSQPSAHINQFVWTQTVTTSGGNTIEEAMVANAATGGTCLIRLTHGALSLATGDSVTYTIQLAQTAGT